MIKKVMLISKKKVNIYLKRAASMESYIKNTLGLRVDLQAWKESSSLPEELQQDRKYALLKIEGIDCLVIYKDADKFQLSDFQKESELLQQFCSYHRVLCFERITSYQRKCLIENHQAFIVPDNQIYMPFLGIALQEHFKAPRVAGQTMTAMAQYVLCFFFYHKEEEYYSKLEISRQLDINLMNVSRSVQELEELSLLQTKKKGRSSMVTGVLEDRQALYEKALPYMRNPVQKRMYVKEEEWLLQLPKSAKPGEETRVRAIEKKKYLEVADRIQIVDPAWDMEVSYLELEVWRYDPVRFTDGNYVDSISYALSLEGDDDMAWKMNINELSQKKHAP